MIAGSTTATGGLAALVATRFHKVKFGKDSRQTATKEDRNGHQPYRNPSSENGPAPKVG
jgi:hypothetical protein